MEIAFDMEVRRHDHAQDESFVCETMHDAKKLVLADMTWQDDIHSSKAHVHMTI